MAAGAVLALLVAGLLLYRKRRRTAAMSYRERMPSSELEAVSGSKPRATAL
jgi:uncharacterized iron-regulated membrane protein